MSITTFKKKEKTLVKKSWDKLSNETLLGIKQRMKGKENKRKIDLFIHNRIVDKNN